MSQEPNISKWAREALAEIYHLEISLGNILPQDQQSPWFTKNFNDLLEQVKKREDSVQKNSDERIEFLFSKIVNGLSREGLSASEIATSINLSIPTGSRLTYCDVASVQEVLRK